MARTKSELRPCANLANTIYSSTVIFAPPKRSQQPRTDRASSREVERDEAGGCRGTGRDRDRRDAVLLLLLRVSARALAESADEQPAGEVAARSAAKNTCGGRISRWQVRSEAGRAAVASRGRHEVGHASLPGHESPRGSERSSMSARAKKLRFPLGGAEHHQTLCLNKCAKNSGHYRF
jgi:hypothetical protein